MTPEPFPESNIDLNKPRGWTDEQCAPSIRAYANPHMVVTCWRPTTAELVRMNLGQPIWLTVVGGGMPPVALSVDSPFEPYEPPQG